MRLFDHLDVFEGKIKEKKLFLFLDYDGTLTPIVDTPDSALLSAEMKHTVESLAKQFNVSVVSGRATDDVRSKVNIPNIFYAGSHGFEIVDPDGNVEINSEAKAIQKTIDNVYELLKNELKTVEGVLVEHVKFTISVHYRLVSDEDYSQVESIVKRIEKEYANLRVTAGKKVFEFRPDIDWHKGKAVEWILDVLGFDPQKNIAIYIGDDTTDEDAFAALADENKGLGIVVMEQARPSRAEFEIKNTNEVKKVLEFLIRLKSEKSVF